VDVLHAVPGKILDKRNPDQMKWEFKIGEDTNHGFLFRTLGVQSMGSIFYTTRVNLERRPRFAREEKVKDTEAVEVRETTKEELHVVTKVIKTRNVMYTGELAVEIKAADTADRLGLNFQIDFIFARRFPVRSVLRLADSAAFLISMVEKIVNNTTVSKPAEAYIGGPDAQRNRRRLIEIIEKDRELSRKILKEIGLDITAVSLRDVSMPEGQQELLQKRIEAEKTAEASVITAKGERDAQIARNAGDADRVRRVIVPAAQNERTVAVRQAEGYEKNKTVTTLVIGSNASPVVPVGGNKP
ncbi:MAG: hypothetical protein Q8P21_02695, partial [bacterium]|nr:hypothetical protein [bacterium]